MYNVYLFPRFMKEVRMVPKGCSWLDDCKFWVPRFTWLDSCMRSTILFSNHFKTMPMESGASASSFFTFTVTFHSSSLLAKCRKWPIIRLAPSIVCASLYTVLGRYLGGYSSPQSLFNFSNLP